MTPLPRGAKALAKMLGRGWVACANGPNAAARKGRVFVHRFPRHIIGSRYGWEFAAVLVDARDNALRHCQSSNPRDALRGLVLAAEQAMERATNEMLRATENHAAIDAATEGM